MAFRILIVDDDQEICSLVAEFLTKNGYQVFTANNHRQMEKVLKQHSVDLIVLDIMLPGQDGLEICRRLREEYDTPIIFVSALGEESDRIVGLEVGGDDYLAKPFSPRELLARIKALLRRTRRSTEVVKKPGTITNLERIRFSHWTLDPNKRCLIDKDGLTIPLSSGEYDLLSAFLQYPNRTLTRDQLLELTQGKGADPFDRSVDVQVGRLRKKIEGNPKDPHIIITVRGGGYRFVTADVDTSK